MIAELQKISYEFLPALLGTAGLAPWRGYRADVNPGIATEFSTVAFRVGHSMLGVAERLAAAVEKLDVIPPAAASAGPTPPPAVGRRNARDFRPGRWHTFSRGTNVGISTANPRGVKR